MTPEELEQQRQQEQAKREAFKQKLKLAQTIAGTALVASASQIKGLDKINQSINEKIAALQGKATEQLVIMASELGIKGLETGNPTLPDLCPSQEILDKILNIRDKLVTDIEITAKYVNIVDQSLKIVSSLLNGSIDSLSALNLLKTATSAATKLTPAVPGAITALLSDLDDIRTLITFKSDGNPRLPELKRAVDLGSTFISFAAEVLNTILGLLHFIDLLLSRCGKKPTAIPEDITTLTNIVQNATSINPVYKGFTFDIIEKPFNDHLNQKIGQAKNSEGIVLLQTKPSFTQDPQVLIEELKLIIDRDNLKAN